MLILETFVLVLIITDLARLLTLHVALGNPFRTCLLASHHGLHQSILYAPLYLTNMDEAPAESGFGVGTE